MNAPLIVDLIDKQASHNRPELMSISEIFGPTIQGEGALIGTPTIFVRAGGCDYRCSWCDTDYAVLPKFKQQWHLLDARTIFSKIEKLSNSYPLWVTLSGGNPALQDFAELINSGQAKGYQFSMETQASIAQPWFSLLDQLTLSPKPPSTGMNFKRRGLDRCLEACQSEQHQVDISLKFVVADENDVRWAKAIADQYPQFPSFIQPCNTDAQLEGDDSNAVSQQQDVDQQRLLWLIETIQGLNWHQVRVLPQLHRWLWGDQTGV